jgi:CHAT domain-containing protein
MSHVANDSLGEARALNGQAIAARRQGRFDDARTLGERSLAITRRLGDQREIARSLNSLGLLAQARGELDEAQRRFTEAATHADSARDAAYIAKIRGNLGMVYQDLGEFDEARRAMIGFREAAASLHDDVLEGNALNNLGMLETRVGDPNRAIEWLGQARTHYDAARFAVGQENALGQLGVAYSERGELSKAFAYLDSALLVAKAHGLLEPEADDLELMAELYEASGDHLHALDLLRQAKALCDSLGMKTKLGHVALAEAVAYRALGNRTLAKARAREAIGLQRAAGARMDELDAELFTADLAQESDDSSAADAELRDARGLAKGLGWATARIKVALGAARVADRARRSGDVISTLNVSGNDASLLTADEQADMDALRARAFLRMKRYDQAVQFGRRAVAGLERIRGNLGTGSLRSSFVADRSSAYADLVFALLALGRTDEAFRVADAARGRALVEHLGNFARTLPQDRSGRDLAEMDEILRRIDLLVDRLRTSDTARSRSPDRSSERMTSAVTRELADARRQYETLLDRVSHGVTRSAVLGLGMNDVAAVRRALAPDEALLEFLSTPERLVVFVVTRDRVRSIDAPIGSGELAERVHLTRELIAARRDAAAPLGQLYAKLVAPVVAAGLLSGIRSLVVVPHAALAYLPFASLRDASGKGTYLVERFAVITVPSASALPELRRRSHAERPEAATVLAPVPTQLPSTRDEAMAVGAQLRDSHVAVGSEATEGALRRALARSDIVHVASHGTLDAESPMFSSIELAPAPRGSPSASDDNGRLETFEVLSLDIHSRLVFLSGCETALGPSWSNTFNRRDDYATLAQAFLYAGAHNVVATLWRIDDRGAAAFAQDFYRELASSSPATALAAAQRRLLSDSRFSAPYYWAAYTISGAGTP